MRNARPGNRVGETVKNYEVPVMPPQTLPKPTQGEEPRWPDIPDWNTPAPEARTGKTETPKQVENMAQGPDPGQVTHDYVNAAINGVRADIAKGFGEANTAIAKEFGEANTAIAKGFGEANTAIAKIRTENAERYSEIRGEIATDWKRMITIMLTALALATTIIGLLIRFLPQPLPATSPPVIVHAPPAPAVMETPAADPPAPLPLNTE